LTVARATARIEWQQGGAAMHGTDEFGMTRTQRIAMADDEMAEARQIAEQWMYPAGFQNSDIAARYISRLRFAVHLYRFEGLSLIARRVERIARTIEVPRAWADFDRLNSKP
jgi:hypothetical protein